MDKGSDEEILIRLKSTNSKDKDEALRQLYARHFPVIATLISKNNGHEDDAADIFQDAIIVFYEKVRLGQLELNCSIQTYLYSVCKNLWLNRLRSKKRLSSINDEMESIPIPEESLVAIESTERQNLLASLISKLGDDCKKVLTHYYFDRLRMREIAHLMGFANEQVAKNKKSGCMKKLKLLVSGNPELKNILR